MKKIRPPKNTLLFLWVTACAVMGVIWLFLLFRLWTAMQCLAVSVVLPTYNRADTYLPRAIESVLNQTFKNFELIIVDDGSTDETKALIHAYMEKDKRIRYIGYSKNKGVSHARNIGNDVARGKYIAIMDSDDFAFPHWLESMYTFASEHPDITIIVPRRNAYFEQNNDKAISIGSPLNYPLVGGIFASSFGNLGLLFQRDFIRKHQIRYDEDLVNGEDWDFWLKMGYAGASAKRCMSTRPVVLMRVHRTNPKNYYQRVGRDGRKVMDGLYQFLNIPPDKRKDQCFILKAAMHAMPRYLPEEEWRHGLQRYCSSDKK